MKHDFEGYEIWVQLDHQAEPILAFHWRGSAHAGMEDAKRTAAKFGRKVITVYALPWTKSN